jgi:glycosyltransferase involved in cell wall biosynthesis
MFTDTMLAPTTGCIESAPLFLNGRFLSQPQSGVQRYAREMAAALGRLRAKQGQGAPILLTPPLTQASPDLASLQVRAIGRLRGNAWEQFELPNYTDDGTLLNLGNTASLFGRRQAVVIHDAAVFEQPAAYPRRFRIWYKTLQRLLALTRTQILTVSDAGRTDIARHLNLRPDSIAVTGEGADHILRVAPDLSVLDRHQLRAQGYVLAVGNLAAHKNLHGLTETANRLARLGLTLAFTGGFDRSVFSTQRGVASAAATYLGRVGDAELRALYENAACFVCPSFYEGFGLPAAEAMTCGCPVVAADIPALRETCGSAALYVDLAKPNDIADAVETLIHDQAARDRLTAAMLQQARRHSWDAAALRLASALR